MDTRIRSGPNGHSPAEHTPAPTWCTRLPTGVRHRLESQESDRVLSIGKLAAGQARYYLDQAEARVDVVQSIGDGIEDYYGGGAEARGEWLGSAARTLGLRGHVEGEALRRVLRGN